jgi:hypothetical protein
MGLRLRFRSIAHWLSIETGLTRVRPTRMLRGEPTTRLLLLEFRYGRLTVACPALSPAGSCAKVRSKSSLTRRAGLDRLTVV